MRFFQTLIAIVLAVAIAGCSVFSYRSAEKKNHPEVSLDTEDTVLKNLEALEQELNKIEKRGE